MTSTNCLYVRRLAHTDRDAVRATSILRLWLSLRSSRQAPYTQFNSCRVLPSSTSRSPSATSPVIAISMVLVIGAGLFLRTLQNVRAVDVGFNRQNLVVSGQPTAEPVRRTARRSAPAGNRRTARDFWRREGRYAVGDGAAVWKHDQHEHLRPGPRVCRRREPEHPPRGRRAELLRDKGGPLLLGRGFTEQDNNQAAPKVAVINQTAVRQFFDGEYPIGRRFGGSPETSGQIEIVGMLADAKYNSLREAAPPTMYQPFWQRRTGQAVFAVRTAGDPAAAVAGIRQVVREVDPALPIVNLTTQAEQTDLRLLQERMFARACTLFGLLALAIAAVGLFGLMSYSVARRTNEIGIRVALGARRLDVLWLVMRESIVLVAVGAAIGLVLAFGSNRLVASLFFGIAATDAGTMLAASRSLPSRGTSRPAAPRGSTPS